MGNLDAPAAEELVPLNFRVPASFRKDYKITTASSDGTDMVDVLRESFELYKRQRTK